MQILIDFCDPYGAEPPLRCAFDAPQQTLVAHTPEQVKPLLDAVEALSQQGCWCVGYLRYEAAPAFDAALAAHETNRPLAWFGVYAQALPWPDSPKDTHTAASTADAATQVRWHSPLMRADFDARMAHIHEAIAAGEYYQVNYTAPLHGEFTGEPKALFKRLQRAQPNGYAAFIDTGFEQVLSVSPELFFDWKNGQPGESGHLLTRPMKGTAPRGNTSAEDDALVKALLASPKERAENVMIVDLLRNDVSRIAEPFSVKVPALFTVQTLPTVFQMVSDVTARTRPGTTLTDLFGALFPCGSITGAPKVQAMRAIKALEPEARGVYCGAIGVVRPGGHATFNVAIRTVTLHGNAAVCGIGSGITFDATADAEWQEWQHKRGFLDRASEAFELLETLRLENGVYINLRAHLARLSRAATHFGYPFDEPRILLALQALQDDMAGDIAAHPAHTSRHGEPAEHGLTSPTRLAPDPVIGQPQTVSNDAGVPQTPGPPSIAGMGPLAWRVRWHREGDLVPDSRIAGMGPLAWRVRLLLDATGQARVEKFILNQPLAPVNIALAATYFEAAHSEFTRFKTTRRSHYEAFAPTDPAVFDTLLYNAQDELTECTRGSIALLLDGRWVTPPLHCGLLDGVGRAMYLKEGRLSEAVVRVDDLPRVNALAFVNSLRGWVDARLV